MHSRCVCVSKSLESCDVHFDLPAALPLPFEQHDRLYWAEAMLDLPEDDNDYVLQDRRQEKTARFTV